MEEPQQSQSRDQLTKLMRLHGEEIKRLIYGYVKDWSITEDLTQEVFISVYYHLDSFNGRSKIRTWLFTIAINKSKDYLRSWSYKKYVLTNSFYSHSGNSEDPDTILVSKENQDELVQNIFKLPVKYREVILLRYYQDLKMNEISEVLGEKPETIRTRLFRAKKKLKTHMEGLFDE